MKAFVVGVLVVTACNSSSSATDAGDDASIDDASPTGRCDPSKPFAEPVVVPDMVGAALEVSYAGAWSSSDELAIYFARWDLSSAENTGIFVATRPDLASPWSAPTKVAERAKSPTLTADQLTMYASTPGSDSDIVVATRASTADPFGPYTVVPELSTAGADEGPYLLRDQETLYVSNAGQVTRWKRMNGAFMEPLAVAGVVGPIVVSDDELTAYVMYTPTNYLPDRTAWMATRNAYTETFTNRTQVTPTAGSSPSWISADNCVLYVVHDSDPRHGTGPISIFTTQRTH